MALRLEEVGLTPESSLLDRARAGDQGAFEELYEQNRDRLYRFCLYQLRSSHDAEDVVQEAFAKAWKALPAMVGDAFYPWLRVIARNLCADVGRRRARVEPMSEIELGYVDDHQEALASRSDVEVLRLALERLPERHRLALQLREQDELSYQEIAERAGITLGTVESLLWRARQGLKRQFQLVSGEGALAGVPGIGWVLVRLRRFQAKASEVASRWGAPVVGLGNAAVVGTVGIVAVTISPGMASAPQVIGTVSSLAVPSGDPVGVVTPPSSANAVAGPLFVSGGAANSGNVPAGAPQSLRFINPVPATGATARQQASADPVSATASVGSVPVAVGADPAAVVNYSKAVIANHVTPLVDGAP